MAEPWEDRGLVKKEREGTTRKGTESRAPRRSSKTPVDEIDRRYMLLELACAEKQCDPCTYPDCQRFVREVAKRPPISTRMFELRSMERKGRIEPDRRYVFVELACKEKKCNPCTYPNCQRFVRAAKKKARFTTPLFELSREDWKKARRASLSESLDDGGEAAVAA